MENKHYPPEEEDITYENGQQVSPHAEEAAITEDFSTEEPVPYETEQEQQQQAPSEPNPFVEHVKKVAKDYWTFLPKAIKNPYEASKQTSDGLTHMINAIITVIIFAISVPLQTYFMPRGFLDVFGTPSLWDAVMVPTFLLMLILVLMVVVKFLVVRLFKATISFVAILARFSVFLVIPTILALIAIPLVLLELFTLSSIFFSIAVTLLLFSSVATLFTIKETSATEHKFDMYHAIILTVVGSFIIIALLGDALMTQFMNPLF
ncbi:hypothetical protein SAMN04488134_105134 [Amphibacillus marinus]|uniref:Yip1 domain-containing protein n=1 Tax=Amphibacillus marinus TaxID=872970 RepID=A0A1H8N5N2_9BACI|nr:DUF6574 domain-containing protein [Amphibacillus marinus]SEO24917.1 hypothetical protein SAMN04488134_105134 [Amphibacillus marinus]